MSGTRGNAEKRAHYERMQASHPQSLTLVEDPKGGYEGPIELLEEERFPLDDHEQQVFTTLGLVDGGLLGENQFQELLRKVRVQLRYLLSHAALRRGLEHVCGDDIFLGIEPKKRPGPSVGRRNLTGTF